MTLAWRDRPAVPAVVLFVLASAYVLLHLDLSAHGDISRFVVAGRHHVVAPTSHLYVDKGDGFDGQFEYRLALAPWDLTGQRGGIVLDGPRDQVLAQLQKGVTAPPRGDVPGQQPAPRHVAVVTELKA